VHRPLVKPKLAPDAPKREAPQEKAQPTIVLNAQRQLKRKAEAVPRRNGARIETPIAQRLIGQDARGPENTSREQPTPPQPAMEQPVPRAQDRQSFEARPTRKGRSFMKLKWFAGNEEELLGAKANGNGAPASEPPQRAVEATARVERHVVSATSPAPAPPADNATGFQAELLAMEDIYRAAGIGSPRRGYSISKVVEMLRNEHLRGQSREVRRAAVLMALDAAGVTVDEVLQDAKVRQEAIDAYAAEQRKHAEAQWARKAEENIQIQAELEHVKSLYAERIRRNLDGVAREKSTFAAWLKMKEQETQGMAEAVEQVLKTPAAPEPPVDPLLSVTPTSVSGKPV
jgi:hypothetical protein